MNNIVYNIDCMEYMKDIPDKWFELAIVDPPYGIGNFTPESDSGSYKKGTKKLQTEYDQDYKWNESTPDKAYFKEVLRVSKKQIIWGANYYNSFSKLGGALVWYKNVGLVTQLSQCEIASLSWKKQVDYFSFKKMTGFISKEKNIHPCQKPVELYKYCLKNYAKPGDKILDTHIGSGSIRIACHDMGFDLYGCELDPDYWQAQEERYKKHAQQNELFNFEGGQII